MNVPWNIISTFLSNVYNATDKHCLQVDSDDDLTALCVYV